MKAGQWSAAREEVATYLREKGAGARRGQAEFVIAMTYHRQQLYGESSAHFDRAIEAEPGFLESYYYGGSAHQNVGNLARARALLAVYARHNTEDARAAFQQGLVELEDDRVDAAERCFERAIAIAEKKKALMQDARSVDDDLGRYYARLGDVFVRRDDYVRAKAAFTKATELRADIPDTWHKLAVACERTGDAAGATRARKVFDDLTAARAQGLHRRVRPRVCLLALAGAMGVAALPLPCRDARGIVPAMQADRCIVWPATQSRNVKTIGGPFMKASITALSLIALSFGAVAYAATRADTSVAQDGEKKDGEKKTAREETARRRTA